MTDLKSLLARYPLRKLTYPAILVLILAIIITAALFAAKSLRLELDRVFVSQTAANSFSIDAASYKLVAAKLNLPESGETTIPAENAQVPAIAPAATPEATTSAAVPVVLDKKALSIGVYNATTVTGLAGKLKSVLEAGGFSVTKTGNEKGQAANSVSIKESKKAYLPLLAPVLGAGFDMEHPEILPEDSTLDCKIIIGVSGN
jgi:LytR cell envelope-related transcriptional attenuator